MSLPDWTNTPDWDVLHLGGQAIPGIARLTIDLPDGLDIQKPKGATRAGIKDQGNPPAEISVEQILLPEELELFRLIAVPLLRPPAKGGARDPLEIQHPMCLLWSVSAVTPGRIGSANPNPGGFFRVSYRLVEWYPAPAAVKKPADKAKSAEAQAAEAADWERFKDDPGGAVEGNLPT